jgi:hypothetical protein
MSKAIRNPSPDDIDKMQFQYQTEAIPEPPTKGVESGSYKALADGFYKPETMFSPPKADHKLIFKYDIENITDKRFIRIRRMTALEEGLFYDIINKEGASTLDLFSVMNNVINSCIKNNIRLEDLNITEKLMLFIHILSLSYGDTHAITLKCPYCEKEFETQLNFENDIHTTFAEDDDIYPKEYKLTSYPFDIYVYIMPPKLEDELKYVSSETPWFEKLKLIIHNISGTLLNDKEVEQSDYDEIIKNLNKEDINNIKKINDDIISSLGIHLDRVKLTFCENKKCDYYNKEIEISIPLDFLFLTVFNNI